jgi:hypothetical protein
VRVSTVVEIAPWIALVVWWFVLLRYRRRRSWLRSAPVAFGLVAATLLADASALIAAERMSPTGGQSLALALLWVAALLSITTYLVLRAPGGGGGGGPGPPDDGSEPPWWPEFEREFRDYARRARRPGARPPRTPAGSR